MARTSRRPGGAAAQDRARRAFARRQWARRWLTWRYVAAGVLLVGLLGLGCYALYFSSWLRTEGVQVVGNSQVSERRVLRAADVPIGRPLVRVDLDRIQQQVGALAEVESVDVSRSWPHKVRIEVEERTPVAVIDRGTRSSLVDEDGWSFGRPGPATRELPRIRIGPGADRDAVIEGAAVVASLDPKVAARVRFVQVRTVDQIELHLRDGRQVRWGSAEQSEDKARVLLVLLDRPARVYDVSVPGAPTTR